MVRAAVERDAVSVQHTEDAGPAGVTAGFPDVVDGVAGVVHADDGLVPILAQAPLGVGPDLAAALQPLLGPPHGRSLGGEAGDGLDDVVRAGVGEELSSRIDPVLDAHKPYFVLTAEIQEDPELADAAQRVAELADDHDVLLAQAGEHPAPLRAVLLLGAVFFYDVVAAEPLHPRKVFVPGGEVLREEKVSDSCHVACCSLPLIYEELLTHQMILGIILHTVPALMPVVFSIPMSKSLCSVDKRGVKMPSRLAQMAENGYLCYRFKWLKISSIVFYTGIDYTILV